MKCSTDNNAKKDTNEKYTFYLYHLLVRNLQPIG